MSRRFLPIPRFRPESRKGRDEDSAFLAFIRSLPCVICRRTFRVEAAHVGQRGLGQKCSDRETIPLCAFHHREGKHAHHRLGKNFWTYWNLDRYGIIAKYQRAYDETERAA